MLKLEGEKVKPGLEGVTTKSPPGVVLRKRKLPPASVVAMSDFEPLSVTVTPETALQEN